MAAVDSIEKPLKKPLRPPLKGGALRRVAPRPEEITLAHAVLEYGEQLAVCNEQNGKDVKELALRFHVMIDFAQKSLATSRSPDSTPSA